MNLREAAQAVWDSRDKQETYSDEHGYGYYYEVDGDALEDMACALAEPEWISVEDALPNEGRALWLARGDEVGYGYLLDVGLWLYLHPPAGESEMVEDVTHWQCQDWPDPPEVK